MNTKRFTPEEISAMADSYDMCVADYHFDPKIADMLRQAATDAATVDGMSTQKQTGFDESTINGKE